MGAREIFLRLRALVRRAAADRDLAEELQFHLDMETEKLVRAGLDPDEARRRARVAFGGVERHKEEVRAIRGMRWLEDLAADIRFALRDLRRSPGFTAVAGLTLAAGIGATTAIFGAVHGVLLRPLPYQDADRLAVIYARNVERGFTGSNVSYQDYLSWKTELRSFQQVGLFNWWSWTLSGDGAAERIDGALVSPDLFSVLGVQPTLGRDFVTEDATTGANPVVILGHGLWQQRYGGERSVLGRSILVDGLPRVVIGVMPPNFQFPYTGQLWMPRQPTPWDLQRSNRSLAGAIVRLAEGVAWQAAEEELLALSRRLEAAYPETNTGWDGQLVSLREDVVGRLESVLMLLLVAVSLVVLVVCANLANLLLAKSTARRREIAMRLAIGAGRGRIVRQFLTEALVLSLVGGVAGLVVAMGGLRLLRAVLANRLPAFVEVRAEPVVFVFAVLITLLVALLFGLLPALKASTVEPQAELKEGARSGSARHGTRLRSALVVVEVALAVILLAGGMLLVKSMAALDGIQPGFDASNTLTARIYLPSSKYPRGEARRVFLTALLERLRALPGVTAAGAAQGVPFSGWNVGYGYTVEGEAPPPPGQGLNTHYQAVSPEFFSVLRVPMVRGRGLLPTDDERSPRVAVVNDAFVARHFSGSEPVGKRIRFSGDDAWVTIVGVVADYRHYSLTEPMRPASYVPFAVETPSQMTLAMRTTGVAADLAPAVRRVLAELDPDVPAYRVETMEDVLGRQVWVQRIAREVTTAFAATAALLAAIGLYGVISYAVARRRHELGVRLALGAAPPALLRLVLRQGLALAAVGIAIGWLAALALSRLISGLLFEVKPGDLQTFLMVPAIVAALALVAAYLPARRAAGLSPVIALRQD